MSFDNEKKQALQKLKHYDKSRKGFIDKEISNLVNLINKHKDYYTTSSCSGRIMILKPAKRKDLTKWLFVSHNEVSFNDLKQTLNKLSDGEIWFKMESPILHIIARNLDAADKLLKKANNSGFRRSAILSFKKRIVIEIMIPERLNVPIAKEKKLLVDENYLKHLVDIANNKLKKTREKLKKLEILFLNEQDNQ